MNVLACFKSRVLVSAVKSILVGGIFAVLAGVTSCGEQNASRLNSTNVAESEQPKTPWFGQTFNCWADFGQDDHRSLAYSIVVKGTSSDGFTIDPGSLKLSVYARAPGQPLKVPNFALDSIGPSFIVLPTKENKYAFRVGYREFELDPVTNEQKLKLEISGFLVDNLVDISSFFAIVVEDNRFGINKKEVRNGGWCKGVHLPKA